VETKTFEIRDRATFVPVVAINPKPRTKLERYLWGREGFVSINSYVLITKLSSLECKFMPSSWGDRTMQVAHQYIFENWDSLENCALIDVEYILGETETKKATEAIGSKLMV
jgi:hypothetical protein